MQSKNPIRFDSRQEAGRELAKRLTGYAGDNNVVVLALPKGGVAVGAEVATILDKPFDILLIGEITAPNCGGKALGAVTSGGIKMLNSAMIDHLHLSDREIREAVLAQSLELARRERDYRGHHPSLEVADRTVILVDDGTTPCSTVRNAIRLLRRQHADRVIFAVPVTCRHAACDLRHEAAEVVTLAERASSIPVEKWLRRFPQTTDDEVRRLLSGSTKGIGGHN